MEVVGETLFSGKKSIPVGFPPIWGTAPETLILGSMPGKASLEARQYYAHPHNQFWRILGTILGFDWKDPYTDRVAYLRKFPIAIWDTLYSCQRDSSLDGDIIRAGQIFNPIPEFLKAHPTIQKILFNGATAEKLFRQGVAPNVGDSCPKLFRLPSTSPAHATLSFGEKLAAWETGLKQK